MFLYVKTTIKFHFIISWVILSKSSFLFLFPYLIFFFGYFSIFEFIRKSQSTSLGPIVRLFPPLQTADKVNTSSVESTSTKVQIQSAAPLRLAMETLAVSSRQLTSTLAFPSTVSVNFKGRVSSSLSLLRSTARVRTLRCSALSSPSLGKCSLQFLDFVVNDILIYVRNENYI